jgi:hypothetical protein
MQDALSTDESISIARRLCGPDDQIVVEPDKGQADALNRAFGRMGGNIVGYINSDDCLVDGAANAVLAAFEDDPSLDLVFGEVDWIDETSRVRGHHAGNISSLAEVLDIYKVWWNNRHWVQPEVFWRRSLSDKVGPFNARYDLAFDYEYWTRCFQAGARVRKIPRTLARFRRHPAQKSSNSALAANEIRETVQQALLSCPPIGRRNRNRLRSMLSYDRYQIGQAASPGDNRPTLFQMLLREPRWALLPEVQRRAYKSFLGSLEKQVK